MNNGRRQVIVVGAGGHARVLVSLLGQLPDVDIVGVLDRTPATMGEVIGCSKVVATFNDLPTLYHRGVTWAALAVGDNGERGKLFACLKADGFSIITARHPSAVVEPDVTIGEGSVICCGAILCAGAVLGAGVIINSGAIVDHEGQIGDFAHIGPGSCVAGRATIGERTFIGTGSRVIDKIRIGANCVIGAGSVVINDIQDNAVAYGIPAKVRRHV